MPRLFSPAHLACLLILSLLVWLGNAKPLRAQGAGGAVETAAAQALDLFNAGRQKEAADAYAAIIKNYPTSTVVSEAQFRLGYLQYLLSDFDGSINVLKKTLGPPAPPEIQELGAALLPQVMSAKAAKMKSNDKKRVTTFEQAIKGFDEFLQKFPNSEEVDNVNYERALASYQIQKYDDAARSLRDNLTRFSKSETALDSEYLLALTLATQASLQSQSAQPDKTAVETQYDNAQKLLSDIIQKRRDLALSNDAQFQFGEIFFNRAANAEPDAKQALYDQAIAAYRAVRPQDVVVKAQEARLAWILERLRGALAEHNMREVRRVQRFQEHEQTKLQTLKGRGDQTVSAQIKVATCFFLEQHFDEARVLLHYLQPLAEDDEQKKQILFYLTMSYVSQSLVDKAVAGYDEFQSKYKGDPLAENLPLTIGILFLSADPKVNDPAKALKYLKEQLALYPKGRFVNDALTQQANALVQLKRYDEALSAFKKILAGKPKKELAAAAEFGIATVDKETGKLDDALNEFKAIRDKFGGTPQAEQAAFCVGQMLMQKGEPKSALAEFQHFIATFPESPLAPTALFSIAQSQAQLGNRTEALKSFVEIERKYPQSDAAPFAYFQQAALYAQDQKLDAMVATMHAFLEAYPDSDKAFFAYDTIAQSQINAGHLSEAIATYNELAEKHPDSPQAPQALQQIAELWQRNAEALGRYIALNEQQRAAWKKSLDGSIGAAERLLEKYPDSRQVSLALQTLLEDQKLLVSAKLKTPDQLSEYFQSLAQKFEEKPTTKSKILFALASFTYEKDKTKALAQMQSAYDPKLVYSPENIDLFGSALIEQDEAEEALGVYGKLAKDFPNPPNAEPGKAPQAVQEAQSIALYGIGKALQKQGKTAEAAQPFDELKKLYPWSPKILEANYGIARSLVEQGKLDEAMTLLVNIIRAATATAELRANAMLLGGEIQEKKNALEPAIDYYIKIATFYEGVPQAASEGLWRGGQLLEKQAAELTGQTKPTKAQQMAKAVRAYKDLSEKYPGSEFSEKAKERLQSLQPAKG